VTTLEWRFFHCRDVEAAVRFAEAGGVAVHHNRYCGGWANDGYCAHLFAPDEATLLAVGAELGLKPEWLQRGTPIFGVPASALHFDLKGLPLRVALARCGVTLRELFQD
jgi:hypothetical protein